MLIDLILRLRYKLSQDLRNKDEGKINEIYFILDILEEKIKKLEGQSVRD